MAPTQLPEVPVRPLGKQGLQASAQGFGAMGMSMFYKDPNYRDEEGFATIRRARELGITLIDTADVYGPHTNEMLVGKALADERDKYVLATKFGATVEGGGKMGVNGSPDYVRAACKGSLSRLGVDTIDLYYQHRVDPNTPIEETVTAMKGLVEEGMVRYLGLSEATADEIRRAHAVHPITAVQLEWSLWTRDAELDLVPTCRELGIGIVCYSPLGRGFLTGQIKSIDDLAPDDSRRSMPRFQGDNFKKNLEVVDKVKEVADRYSATPGQVALAWLHAQGEDVFPIPGTKRIKYLEENVKALSIKLKPEDVQSLSELSAQILGERYGEAASALAYHKRHQKTSAAAGVMESEAV